MSKSFFLIYENEPFVFTKNKFMMSMYFYLTSGLFDAI